uniref:RING-type E3 ubiquitin transferase n=1 Tax=Oryza brachyantha TaxID=4533 RepID=J3MX34_ORYBR
MSSSSSPPPPSKPTRRRLLCLPAVYPCEGITPAPLLASLVSLVADVAGRPACDVDAFPVLRRGVRTVVRLAGILLAFLEELREAVAAEEETAVPPSAVLGLTELHVAMQKLRFLLTDCARRGARLWVLVNAALVASELRLALGSVAAAMDALPRGVADASVEAGELARLVSKQAWPAWVRPDGADERAARSVRSILEQFKDGVAPDPEDVKRVLRRVRVGSWSECSEEIAFLESELCARLDAGDENSNDVVVMNSLMAFLVYCRVVLFDHIDSNKSQAAATTPARCPEWIRPDALQCPITLDLMTDPVTVSTGQTYDRASITRWMKSGCRTCPVTGERLRTADVVPNAALRGIVERMLLSNGVTLPEPSAAAGHRHGAIANTSVPFGPAAAGAARLAVAYIVAQLSRGSTEERRKATSEARKLSKHSVFYRACLVDANAVPWMLCLLSSTDAAQCVVTVHAHEDTADPSLGWDQTVIGTGGDAPTVFFGRHAVWNILSCKKVKRNCRKISSTENGKARLAQSVERKALNLVVVGSSPTVGAVTNYFYSGLDQLVMGHGTAGIVKKNGVDGD